jgi:Icc protein
MTPTRHLLFQLSDIHLLEDPGGRLRSGAHPLENLERAIDTIVSSTTPPDAIVLSGDLSDDGSPDSYQRLAARLAAVAESTGAATIVAAGNHDEREALREHLLGQEPSGEPLTGVVWLGGLRVVTLDSTVPGSDAGSLGRDQLEWLRTVLSSPAPLGTVLVLHHPPVPSPIRSMTAIALEDPLLLGQAINGSDVALILAGHNHHGSLGVLGHTPVWVSPAVAYRADVMNETEFRGLQGSAFSRIDIVDKQPLVTVVPVAHAS